MNRRRFWVAAASGLTLTALAVAPATVAAAPEPNAPPNCSSGAHTLSHFGDHVYPETGNGGYTSLHTDVHMVYDAPSNQFLPGNHVVLTAARDAVPDRFQPGLRAHERRTRTAART